MNSMELSRRDQIVGNVRVGVTGFAEVLNVDYLMKVVSIASRAFCLSY